MEQTNEDSQLLQTERLDTKEKLSRIAKVGIEVLSSTALVQDRKFTEEDLEKAKKFFQEARPFIHPKVWPVFWEHLDLASKYCRILGKEIQNTGADVDPLKMETLGLLHDVGRLISPHRYFRSVLVGDSLLKKIGVRDDVIKSFVPESQLVGRGEKLTSANQLTLEQQILLYADNFGRKVDGNLLTLGEYSKMVNEQLERYPSEAGVFASERFGEKKNCRPIGKGI